MEQVKLGIPQAIIFAGIIIAAAIFLTRGTVILQNDNGAAAYNTNQKIEVAPLAATDHVLGNRDAKVVIIEFSDTECPYCKTFQPTMHRVIAEEGSNVAWVYRHFPLDALHKKARRESEATECAAEQGGNDAFWSYLDEVFNRTNSNDSLDPAELPRIASSIGLDVVKFNTCLASGKHKEFIEGQFQDGLKAGVTGTPSSVVMNVKTGKKTLLVGAQSYENILGAIDSVK